MKKYQKNCEHKFQNVGSVPGLRECKYYHLVQEKISGAWK